MANSTASNDVLLVKEIDPSNIDYSTLKDTKNGSKACFINYKNKPFFIQLPQMVVPFAINETGYDGAALTKYVLPLAFRGLSTDPRLQLLKEKLQGIEEQVITDGVNNSLTWFKKKSSHEFVEGKFCRFIKYPKDKATGEITDKYDPHIQIKLPYDFNDGQFKFTAYDGSGNEIDFATIKGTIRGAKVRLIIQVTGLWFTKVGFGLTTRAVQGQFELASSVVKGLKFRKDSDDEGSDDDKVEDKEALDDIADDADHGDPSPKPVKAVTVTPPPRTTSTSTASTVAPKPKVVAQAKAKAPVVEVEEVAEEETEPVAEEDAQEADVEEEAEPTAEDDDDEAQKAAEALLAARAAADAKKKKAKKAAA